MGQYRRRSFSAGHGVKTKSQFPTVSILYENKDPKWEKGSIIDVETQAFG